MVDFSTIQTRVNNRVIDLPATVTVEIPDLVNKAIRKAQEKHNFRIMEAEEAQTTTENTRLLGSIPADWKEKRARPFLRLGQDGELGTQIIDWSASKEDMLKRYKLDDTTNSGRPIFIQIATAGTKFHVWPFPNASSQWDNGLYRVVMPYWKFLPDLGGANVNWFTANMEDYIVNQATAEAMMLNWDADNAAKWYLLASDEFNRGKRLDKLSQIEKDISIAVKSGGAGVAPRRA